MLRPYREINEMRNCSKELGSLALGVALFGCSAPIGPIPGGTLSGELASWPENWAHVEDRENVLLQTNPEDPYSVTIWGLGLGSDFYIAASKRTNRWAQYLEADPSVVLNVDGKLYEATASRVSGAEEALPVSVAFRAKYDVQGHRDFENEGSFYRLTARPTAN